MKKQKKTVAFLFLSLGLTVAHAQQSTTVNGGDASGSGGTAAYSIGQVVYTTNTGTTGSVAQGVQQPYEISIVLGLNDNLINLNMIAFPNPTTNFLQLKTENNGEEHLDYQLYDITGKLIESKKITNSIETIQMEVLPKAIYFLKVVSKNNKELKTFKIIKN